MNGHASINRLYRLVWSEAQGGWVAVAENARGRGKASGRSKLAATLFAGLALGSAAHAQSAPAPGQLPTGGQVAAGGVAITQSGNHMDVHQTTQRGAIDWATFNIGSQAQVNFAQPSAASVTLNRVQDTQASQIFGRLTSNGQVFLSNPNGVYFSPTASVDVGGLVATTGSMSTADFMAGGSTFMRDGATGSVVNDGTLTALLGGYIALLAPEVRNNGIVTAQAGTVALASGDAIQLQFGNSRSLTGVLVSPSTIAALVENGNAVRAPGGLIILSAQAADQLQGAVVRNTGTLEATGLTTQGGRIVLESSGLVDNGGSADVSGRQGGSIAIAGDHMLSTGTLRADGSSQGGSVTSTLADGLVETTSALVSATGGGYIAVDAGAGQLYTSGTYHADGLAAGQKGGSISITAAKVALMGATASADGAAGGGSVLVGGDLHGANAAIANATSTTIGSGVTLSADAIAKGNGGKVVVWADDTTNFAGMVSAKGGATSGNGGQLEVSGKGTLHFNGSGDASAAHGTAGNLLLDPKNIIIDDQVSAQIEYIDPHSTATGTFGAEVDLLTSGAGTNKASTGYVVITNPTDNLAATNGGAVYLFRQSDQALISTLYGTHAQDSVGYSGSQYSPAVTSLTNGNFVVGSPSWNGGRGAVTFGNGTTGWGAGATAVSAGNSLVGSLGTHTSTQGYNTSDNVGAAGQVQALSTGNYIVGDSGWNNGAGAVAFGNGTTGSSGVVSATTALVGSTTMTQTPGNYISYLYGDNVGGGVTVLANGNYLVADQAWNKGVGMVALGSGTTGLAGVVSATTALIGTTSRSDATGNGSGTDKVGYYVQILNGSEFVVYNSGWNINAGEVTWSDGSTLAKGVVSSANSLVGAAGESLGSGGIKPLPGKSDYVISSPSWGGGKGAATYVAFGTNVKNLDIATNGITGATAGDAIGSQSVTVLADGDYVLSSSGWSSGKGAVTLVDGNTGKTKVGQAATVDATNSVVGTQTTDHVGQNGVLELTGNGNYLVLSPVWSNGGTSKVGAVTWSSGSTPTVGAVSAGNSLVGSTANDRVGENQYNTYGYGSTTPSDNQFPTVTALTNGNYVVASPMWNGTRGAVTWGNGATGSSGAVTSANSLVGSNAGDYVGSFNTIGYGISPTPAFFYMGNGVQALANGNYVVESDFWKNGSAARAGALTWSDGSTGGTHTTGLVTSANSLVGSTANDMLANNNGSNGFQQLLAGYDGNGHQLFSGNYVVQTFGWDNGAVADAGAITWGSGTAATTGALSTTNSLVGGKTGEMGAATVTALSATGNYVVLDALRDLGGVTSAGALTFMNGSTGRSLDYTASGNKNIVSAANSVVGSTTDDFANAYVVSLFKASTATGGFAESTGNYVLTAPYFDNGAQADAGAVTWGSGTSGSVGVVSRANSIVGDKAGDYLGSYSLMSYLPTGDYVVGNPTRDIGGVANAGAATWMSGNTGQVTDYAAQGNQNIVSAANSMVGSHPDDRVGNGLYSFYDALGDVNRNGYFIFSVNWNCDAGALTYVADGSAPMIGVVNATNSAVGDPNGRFIGGLSVYTPYPAVEPGSAALATFMGDGGHVFEVAPVMPATTGMAINGALGYADAGTAQMITPDYVAGVLRTGTSLTLQASNDILVRAAIDATGGTAGGSLTLDAGRSIAILGDIKTGNRDLTLVANDTLANGVVDAQRDAGIATISMGANLSGHLATIDAGSGTVSVTMGTGAGKTNAMGGSIGLNSITAGTIQVADHGNGLGTLSDLPTFVDCCGFGFGYRGPGADIVLNSGAVMHATGTGTAVTLAADGKFTNSSGSAAGTIAMDDPAARWLVYANAPGTSTFGGLDSGDTAVWHQTYDANTPVAASGNRYVFAYQPTVTVNTQNATKVYGTDLTGPNALSNLMLSVSGAQAGVSGAYLGDTLSTAITGSPTVTSAGAAATAGVAGGPYAVSISLAGITGNNGYAVSLGSNTPRTLSVTAKALTAALTGVTKVYDATNAATLTNANYALGGLVNGDTFNVTQAAGTFNSANVAGATSASATLAASNFSGLSGALASNYTLPTSATGSASITPKALTATLASQGKTYDGNASATLTTASYTLGGFVGAQSATVTKTSGSYNSDDVASATGVSTTLAGGDFTAGSGTTLSNYSLPTTASGSAAIAPKQLATTLSGSLGKVYDGTTADTLNASEFNVTGFVGGQSATVTQTSGSFNSPNVASATTVTATLAASDYAAGNGTTLSNYVLPASASAAAAISRAGLTVTANNASKIYDGVAWSGGNGVSYGGFVNNETASVLGGTLAYGGSAQGAVNVGSYAIVPSGLTAANYTLSYVPGTLAIDPRQLIAVTASLVGNLGKTYDGTNVATFGSSNFSLLGFVNGDSATVTRTTGTYDGVNAGSHVVSATLAGGDFAAAIGTQLSNYTLPTVATGSGTIAQRAVTLTAPTLTRVYDGGTAWTTTAGNLAALSTALVGGDTVSAATLAYTDRNAGAGNRAVTLGGVTLSDGNNGNNYLVTLAGNANSTITPRTLTVGATATGRVYDATRNASVSLSDNRVANDQLTITDGSALFADKNAGTGKTVNVAGLAIAGTDAGNYVLASASTTASADITPATLVVGGVAAANRSYNAQIAVALTGTPTVSALGSDVVAVGGTPVATMADKNVGTGKAVTVGGYTITDPNYVLVQPAGLSVDITPALLQVTGVGAVNRAYDTSTGIALSGTAGINPLAGDVVTLSGTPTATTANKNAGTGKAVTVTGYTINDANYVLVEPQGLTVDIAPALLQLGGLTTPAKTYDGTTSVALNGTPAVTGLNGEVVNVSGTAIGQTADKNVGANKAVTVSGLALSDPNYVLGQEPGLAATVTPAALLVSGLGAVNRTYDTSTGITLSGTASISPIAGDVVTLSGTPTATVANKNAATGKAVTVSGYSINDANYVLVEPQGLTVDIAPALLQLGGLATAAASKTYDASTTVALSGAPVVSGLNGEVVNVTGTAVGQTADKNVGANKAITVSGLALSDPNYVLGQQPGLATTVTPAALLVTGVGAVNRAYDTSTGIALSGTAAISPIAGDVVALSGTPTATTANKNAGTGKAVTVSGYTINDANYMLVEPQGLTVDITPALLQLGGLATAAASKTYDGSTVVALSGAPVVSGLNGEVVNVTGTAVGRTADKNVGANKAITVSGLALSDPNYVLGQEPGLAATVMPAALLVTGVAAVNRSYDTSTGIALSGAAAVSPIAGDVVTLSGTPTATTGNKNAGTGKAVTVSGYTINDSNYVLVEPQGLTVDIAPAVLQLGGLATTAASKTYDGSTAVALSGAPVVSGLNGEVVTVSGAAVGRTADKNVGASKAITVSGLVPSDSNYVIGQEPGLAATVTPAALVISGMSAVNRTYDTTTGVALAGNATIHPIAGDVVTLAGAPVATTADKNAGNGKAVTVGGYSINDANYVLVEPTGLTVDVAPAVLALGGLTTAATKTYDASRTVALGGTPTVTGLNGEVVNVVGTAVGQTADKNVGANKAVTVSGLATSDANYVLAQEPGLATTITPASLLVTGVTAVDRTYDTRTGVALAGTATVSPLGDDVVALGGSGVGTMADKNAGRGKAVNVGGYSITDPNYALVQPKGVTVNIAQAVLQLGGVTTVGATKTYDGTRSVGLSGAPVVTGLNGEVVTLSGTATGTTADKNVGSGKAITVGGLVPSDANYAVGQQPGLAIDVTPATLAVGGVTASDKRFDGNANATLAGIAKVAPVAGDDVTLTGTPEASFASADVGVAKPVTVTGYAITGADKGNYVVRQPAGLAADITAPPVVPQPVVVPTPALPLPPKSAPLALPLVVTPIAAGTVTTDNGILVSLVREPAQLQQGVVSVGVPKEIATAGAGFSFPMPAQITQAYTGGTVTATLPNGQPLPTWVQYDSVANTFVVTQVPAGGLPLQVLVLADGQAVVVTIAER